MYRIDDDLKEFLESGVAILVGSADEQGHPQLAQGWGPMVAADRVHMSVFLDTARAHRTLANLRATRNVAVTFASPISYRSVQIKGHFLDTATPNATERDWVQHHRHAFLTATALIGDPLAGSRNLWMDDVIRLDFSVDRAFNQTPGPEAGNPL
ncbi:MAG: pyridoxamine 5'-phosphate oxidase family protein [Dehalococcoidia bacterium]|nr:pyridoxamine 5'-phosphate oxidase family protein [Dehalococcoidia bacterium]